MQILDFWVRQRIQASQLSAFGHPNSHEDLMGIECGARQVVKAIDRPSESLNPNRRREVTHPADNASGPIPKSRFSIKQTNSMAALQ
jgi:hypothetical protein